MALMLETRHDYRTCNDDDCPLFGCRVYRDGFEDGYRQGYAAGYGAGYSAGYGDGYADGAASADAG